MCVLQSCLLTSMIMGHTHSRATATVVSLPTELVKTGVVGQQAGACTAGLTSV